jgi:hypothetical protein
LNPSEVTVMQVRVESILPCAAADAWNEVCRSELLHRVTWPLFTLAPADSAGLPEKWEDGATIRIRLRLLGMLPLGVRTLYFEKVDATGREIQTREHDQLIRRWDHLISVRPHDNQTAYSDSVEIDAGCLTLFVWLFAHLFYRYRQWRWQSVARTLRHSPKGG